MKTIIYCAALLLVVAFTATAGGSSEQNETGAIDSQVERFAYARLTDRERALIDTQPAPGVYTVQLSEEEWRARLDDFSFFLLREGGTEREGSGALWDNWEAGTYYSKATGEPVFSSEHKYDSGVGYPSFFQPIRPDAVRYHIDRTQGMIRVAVVDALSGSHLGHVFPTGPEPTGLFYCMNSESLVFVPAGEEPPALITQEVALTN